MRVAGLLFVMVLAKCIAVAGHRLTLNPWSPVAYFWHDALVVLIVAALDTALVRLPRLAWSIYAVTTLYVAINVPVSRVLSTPLTWAMWRAARGPLTDSIRLYFTWQNALLFLIVLSVAILAPFAFRQVQVRNLVAPAAAIALLGPIAAHRVESFGLERNAWTAIAETSLTRIASSEASADWRIVGFDQASRNTLTAFSGAAAGRNVILISLESTAAKYLGIYGATPDPMPRLAALAQSAIVFENAYAVYPESIKGLFSILCSTYPALDSAAENYAAAPCASLAEILGAHGYATGLFHSGRFGYLGMESVIRNRGFGTLVDAGDIGGNHNSSFGVDEPATVARLLRWIDERHAGQPFFAVYLPIAGHHPYETPEPGPFPDDTAFGRYRNALRYGDESLGALIDGIADRGLREHTLWIVLGDHGEAFGQHDGNYGHTFQLYEENVHVPLLIAAPGLIHQKVRSGSVVSLIDTAPGVLDLLGAPPSALHQGRSFLDPAARMALFFADYSLPLLGLRDGSSKVILELNGGRPRLFDLISDPGETRDRSMEEAGKTRWYAQNLRAWSTAQQASLHSAR